MADYSKYTFDGETRNKRQTVLAVMQKYISQNPKITLAELENEFPKKIQGSFGVFDTVENIERIASTKENKQGYLDRFFMAAGEIITLCDGVKIAVCNQWGEYDDDDDTNVNNFDSFLTKAMILGYEITKA